MTRLWGKPRASSAAPLPALLLALATASASAAGTLIDAASANDTTGALAAIEDGVDVESHGPDGTTALHYAVYHDNVALVERLIEAGAGAWNSVRTITPPRSK